jgi:hypothetical protein
MHAEDAVVDKRRQAAQIRIFLQVNVISDYSGMSNTFLYITFCYTALPARMERPVSQLVLSVVTQYPFTPHAVNRKCYIYLACQYTAPLSLLDRAVQCFSVCEGTQPRPTDTDLHKHTPTPCLGCGDQTSLHTWSLN